MVDRWWDPCKMGIDAGFGWQRNQPAIDRQLGFWRGRPCVGCYALVCLSMGELRVAHVVNARRWKAPPSFTPRHFGSSSTSTPPSNHTIDRRDGGSWPSLLSGPAASGKEPASQPAWVTNKK